MSLVAKLIARAKEDADFKAKLLADPQSALQEAGIELPKGSDPDVTADLGELAPLLAANHRGSYDDTVELDAPGGVNDQTLKAEAGASAGADTTLEAVVDAAAIAAPGSPDAAEPDQTSVPRDPADEGSESV